MKKLCAMLIALAVSASAQAANLDQGTWESSLDGGIDFQSANGTAFALGLGLGHYVVDNIEVGGRLEVFNDDVLTLYAFGPFVEYNFDLGTPLVPFVGASLLYANAEIDLGPIEEDEDALIFSLYGGVKYFVTEDLSVFILLDVDWATEEIFADDNDVEDTDFSIRWGLRYNFDL
jgi:opacity protein-like surface antigen